MNIQAQRLISADDYPQHPEAETPKARGDKITGDRYYSKEFAER